ncbi:MAG: hypothetical protein H6658_07665 [Ardenticatenaceae bacterium]|nr:hypothetical protein [Ardenticatenaceae bacterium]
MESLPTSFLILGSFLAFTLLWIAIIWLIGSLGGWAKIAEKYPARQPWSATCWHMQSAQLRGFANYSGILKICADAEGIHVATIIFFSMGHAPFSVPWVEINGRQRRRFLINDVELRFQRIPHIPMSISPALANRLVAASGGAWRYEEVETNKKM